jgi:phage tail-like protein
MAQAVKRRRPDPYRNFNFRVILGGAVVAGFSEVTGLSGDVPAETRRAARARKLPGLRKFTNITLKRGITQDRMLRRWMTKALGAPKTPGIARGAGVPPPAGVRNDVTIAQHNARGRKIASFKLRRCWISKAVAPALDAAGNEIAIEVLTLQCEGLEAGGDE